jgi:hypothetical protein
VRQDCAEQVTVREIAQGVLGTSKVNDLHHHLVWWGSLTDRSTGYVARRSARSSPTRPSAGFAAIDISLPPR